MSLAGVRKVWEDLSPRKGVVKKPKRENMGTISGANIDMLNKPTTSANMNEPDFQMLSEIHNIVMKVSHSQYQHVADMADMRSKMRAVIKEEITSLKNEFTEKMNLLEKKLQDRDKKIEVLE